MRQTLMIRRARISAQTIALVIAAAGLSACAGDPPIAQMATSRAAVERAQQSGLNDAASADLANAQRKLAEAQLAEQNKDYDRAARLAAEAEADARLAQARAESARSQEAVQALEQSLNTLRNEINRQAQ